MALLCLVWEMQVIANLERVDQSSGASPYLLARASHAQLVFFSIRCYDRPKWRINELSATLMITIPHDSPLSETLREMRQR